MYANVGSCEFYQKPVRLSPAFFVLALIVAVPRTGAADDLEAWPEVARGIGDYDVPDRWWLLTSR